MSPLRSFCLSFRERQLSEWAKDKPMMFVPGVWELGERVAGEGGNGADRPACLAAPPCSGLMIINCVCALTQFASFLSRRIALSHLGIFKRK